MSGPRSIWLTPLRVVLVYAAFGAAWILFSDQALTALVPDPVQRDHLQSAKGLLFVAATAGLIYFLVRAAVHERRLVDEEVRAVLEGMADGVLVVDAQRRIVDANQAAQKLFGLSEREALLEPFERFIAGRLQLPDGTPVGFDQTATGRALRGETVSAYEVRHRAPDGRELYLSVSAAPVPAGSTSPRFAVTVVRDVTDTMRFEDAREEFIAAAAHEFRTPLAVVKAYAQLMERRGQGDPAALKIIDRQVDRLTRMLQHLLDVSRFRLGGAELRREDFDLAALLREVAEEMSDQADGRSIRVQATEAIVRGDRARIEQVIQRLLENALRFSPRGEPVEAALVRDTAEALLSVRDHGPGIPPERRAHVFERSYRTAAAVPDPGVMGGGLDVSREIVARHGGRMWLDSEMGRGSTFTFTLPLAQREAS